jgi:hypothetical protein
MKQLYDWIELGMQTVMIMLMGLLILSIGLPIIILLIIGMSVSALFIGAFAYVKWRRK